MLLALAINPVPTCSVACTAPATTSRTTTTNSSATVPAVPRVPETADLTRTTISPSILVSVVRLLTIPSLTALPARPRGLGTTTGAGFADRILRDDAADLVAFTVIVRGACRFALLVAILILAFKVVFGLIERLAAASSPVARNGSARPRPKCATSGATPQLLRHRTGSPLRRGRGAVLAFMLC